MLVDRHGDMIETIKLSDDGKKVVKQLSQDVQPYFEANARERIDNTGGWKGDFHKVASIPLVVFEQMNKEAGCNLLKHENRDKLIALLNSSDYLKTRTKEGRI